MVYINRDNKLLQYPGRELTLDERKQRLYHYTSFNSFVRIWLTQTLKFGVVTDMERYFRPEGNYGDGVGVIPIDVGNKLRLYCLRLSDKILVFGNGGVKDARTWQESETLAPYVKLLVDTSRFISSRIKDGTMVLVDKEIVGNINFTRYEEE